MEAKETVALVVLLLVGRSLTPPLGGVMHALVSSLIRLPKVGKIFGWILGRPLALNGLLKPIAWAISGSGAAAGLLLFMLIFGEPTTATQLWTVLVVAIVSVLSIAHRMVQFDFTTPDHYLLHMAEEWSSIFPEIRRLPPDSIQKLMRSNYTDLRMVELASINFSFGLVYYALDSLRFLGSALEPTTALRSIYFSYSKAAFLPATDAAYTGPIWAAVSLGHTAYLFIWLVAFFELGSSLIPSSLQWPPDRSRGNGDGVSSAEASSNTTDSTSWRDVETRVKQLKAEGRNEDALGALQTAFSRQSKANAPSHAERKKAPVWAHEQMAILLRKLGRGDEEIAALEEYLASAAASGKISKTLASRLARLVEAKKVHGAREGTG